MIKIGEGTREGGRQQEEERRRKILREALIIKTNPTSTVYL